jgi:Na+:H+ antiporter, NhaA family
VPQRLFTRGSWLESSRTAEVLRAETTGGLLLIAAAVVALVWANSPAYDAYFTLRDHVVGPAALHLDLSIGAWAADGLLAIFFFVAGLELKRELVVGDLRDPRRALLPVAAAVGGVALPCLIYLAVNHAASTGDTSGWAIPSATDIAFALAVLAILSSHLPVGLRTFLLTLAVVDDLIAITIIAVAYTDALHVSYLLLALVPIAAFGVLAQRGRGHPALLILLAITAWALVHASGIHATVAGVLLAFTVPADRAGHVEHRLRPLSAGFAVPVFAFFAAGVDVGGLHGLGDALRDPVALGIVAGLVAGKAIGVTGATALVARFTRAELDEELAWPDVIGLGLLAGVGFTVSLLIGELAFGQGSARDEHVKVGVLVGSLVAIALASVVLRARDRAHRRDARGAPPG